MAAWYLAKAWLLESPDKSERVIATKPQHSYVWENWTVTRDNGTTITVPQRVHRKYFQNSFTCYYDKVYEEGNEATMPTVALMRVDGPQTLDVDDYMYLMDTQNKWDTLFATYPLISEQLGGQVPT